MLKYKGLHATLEHLTVSDAQVDQQIDKLLEQNQKTVVVTDRPSQLDDEVMVDFKGFLNGTPFDGGAAENHPITLGSGAFIPGFEEQLTGRSTGEECEVRVTFPEQYPVEALAGQEAVFQCKVREIHIKCKYAPDDVFAREIGGCESFAAMRQSVRDSLQSYIDRQADAELKNNLMDQVCETMEVEITDDQLQKALDFEVRDLEAQLGRQGLNLDMYCQFLNKTREQIRDELVPDARKSIRRQAAIAQIAELENIAADEASIAAAIEALCQENNITIEQLQPFCDEQFQNSVARSVVTEKVLELIKQHAVVETIEK